MVDKKLTGILYLICSGFLLLTSCETVLDLELHAIPKLTIISNLNPDDPAGQRVYVYASHR